MVYESKRPSFADLNVPPDESEEQVDPDTIDTGIPIDHLVDLGEPVSEGFFYRVMNRVERRRMAAEVGRFAWAPVTVFRHFFDMLFGSVESGRDASGPRGDRGPSTPQRPQQPPSEDARDRQKHEEGS